MGKKQIENRRARLQELNHMVFWPPFLLLLLAVVLNFAEPETFTKTIKTANEWVLGNFGWLFSICAFSAVVLIIFVFFSKFSSVRIGGEQAQPLMSSWNWFSITICTTIAVGILFWATAEPIYHFRGPPVSKGIEPRSTEAASFAMAAMFLHWTFTPYAIYCVASLTFAFTYYNMRKPFSLGSVLTPIFGDRVLGKAGGAIDAVCLFALVAGMAASLGTGILNISGGLTNLWEIPRNSLIWALIATAIVATFIVSSATGLMKGIRILSDINTKALCVLAVIAFFVGPTIFILSFGIESLGVYLTDFFEMSLFTGTVSNDPWPQQWTVFYWALSLAWTPVTACFLGRITYGRTVREVIIVNLILPSLFGMAWMSIFSGTALNMVLNGADLENVLDSKGTEAVAYAVFETFPFAVIVILFYLVSAFICFVTSADSNTSAMASISTTGISPENPEGNVVIKIAWGLTVGLVAWVMISFADVEGIKILSNLGGFPAAILFLLVIVSLTKIVLNFEEFNIVDQN